MSEERKTVRVRVAVVVDGGGQWGAHGWGLAVVGRESGYDKHAMKAAEDELDPPLDDLRSVVFLEADIPLPSAPTVEGEVAGEAARREAPVFYQVCSVQGDTVHARRELESSTLCGVTNFNGTPDYFDPDNPPAFACLRCRKALRRDIEGGRAMTAADLAPKADDCPFCGGPLQTYEAGDEHGRFAGYYLGHLYRADTGECAYGSGTYETEAEAVTAHNTLSRRAALFPELVALLHRVDVCDQEDGEEWWSDRSALLKRAAEITPEVQR